MRDKIFWNVLQKITFPINKAFKEEKYESMSLFLLKGRRKARAI